MEAIAIILAKSHSRRFPGKNLATLGMKPLLQWVIESAKASGEVKETYVSTDSPEYMTIALQNGAKTIERPPELCLDTSTSESGVMHALKHIGASSGVAVLLQATSPLTRPSSIAKCVQAVLKGGADTAMTIHEAHQKPNWALTRESNGRILPFILLPKNSPFSSETPPPTFWPTGGAYAFQIDYFLNTNKLYGGYAYGVIVGEEEAIDVDTPFDLGFARYVLKLQENSLREKEIAV